MLIVMRGSNARSRDERIIFHLKVYHTINSVTVGNDYDPCLWDSEKHEETSQI